MRTVSSACSGGNRITEFRLVKVEDTGNIMLIWELAKWNRQSFIQG